jgi:hypothetical protein
MLRTTCHGAAAAFCAVSLAANLRYGLSLGTEPLDKGIYAAASVAADVFKIGLPLHLLALWAKRYRVLSVAGFAFWLACLGWSLGSAVGFALSSRADMVAERAAALETRIGWEATVHRAEEQLSALGRHRPVAVVGAELAATAVPPHIWQRTNACAEATIPESQTACAPILRLRKELAAAESAARLESRVEAGRTQLDTLPMAASSTDPQVGALVRLTGQDEATIRTGLALFLAALIEAGSALGFTLLSAATGTTTPPAQPGTVPRSKPATHRLDPPLASAGAGYAVTGSKSPSRAPRPAPRPERATSRHRNPPQCDTEEVVAGTTPPQPASSNAPKSNTELGHHVSAPRMSPGDTAIRRWAQSRIEVNPAAEVPARAAYEDFGRWCRAQQIESCSETRFGRVFTTRISELGGCKVKRRDRAYYVGVSLAAQGAVNSRDRSEDPQRPDRAQPALRFLPNGRRPQQRWQRWRTTKQQQRREPRGKLPNDFEKME